MPHETALPITLPSQSQAGRNQFNHNATRTPWVIDLYPPASLDLVPGTAIGNAEIDNSGNLSVEGTGSYVEAYAKTIPAGVINEIGEGIDFEFYIVNSSAIAAGTFQARLRMSFDGGAPTTLFTIDMTTTTRPFYVKVVGSVILKIIHQTTPSDALSPVLEASFGLIDVLNVGNVVQSGGYGAVEANPTNRVIGAGGFANPGDLEFTLDFNAPASSQIALASWVMRFHPQVLASLE